MRVLLCLRDLFFNMVMFQFSLQLFYLKGTSINIFDIRILLWFRGLFFNMLSHDSILFATSNTNRYRTSFFSNLSIALLMYSMGITSIMHLMSFCAAKFNISCISSTPPIKLPPILLLPRKHFK